MLEPLGVRKLAEDVYRALLTHGATTCARLAGLLDVDPDDVTKCLGDLRELGLATPLPGTADRWRAEPPNVALASLVVRHQEALLERQRDFERAQATVNELLRIGRTHGPGHGADAVEVTSDIEVIRRRSGHFARTAEQCVLALDTLPCGVATTDPYAETAVSGDLALLGRHVDIQAVYERPALVTSGRFETLRRLAAAGEQVRTLPALPMKMVVYDRAHAVVQLDDKDEVATTALLVHHSGLLAGLVLLFELLWERAVPLPPASDASPAEGGAECDDVLVALLAAGFKDESIARHLGISPSTVTRRMARLMEISGASTRFQLGMQAVRRRWI